MASCYWKKIRLQVAENSILKQDALGKDQLRLVDLVWKQQARKQRCFIKAQHELQRLQEERRRHPDRTGPHDEHRRTCGRRHFYGPLLLVAG